MKKIKISSLLFWGYIAFIYLSFVGFLIYLGFKVKNYKDSKPKEIYFLKDYSNVMPVKKFDTLTVKSAKELDIVKIQDTFIVASNGELNVTQIGNSLIIGSGDKIGVVSGNSNLILKINSDLSVSAKGLKNLTVIGDSVELQLSAGYLDKLVLKMTNSKVNVGAAKIDKIVLNIVHTNFNLASVGVKEITGWADSTSLIAAVRILGSKINVKGGAKVSTNKK